MIDRQLTKLIDESVRRANGPNPVPWVIVGVAAALLRRSLREGPEVQSVKIREGSEVTIALRGRDD